MSDWRDQAKESADWRTQAEGGAEGGSEGPSKPLLARGGSLPTDPDEAKRRMSLAVSGMTGGQNIASLPADKQEEFRDKSSEKALGQVIAGARGVPLTGAHIDELSAALQSGKMSGADYESKRDEARKAVDKAVGDNPALPTVASLAFAPLQPTTGVERVALSTVAGGSEGMGAAQDLAHAGGPMLKGAGVGLAAGLGGEALNAAGGALGKQRDAVVAKNEALTSKNLEKAFGSARSKYGGEVSSGSNLIQSAERAVGDTRLPDELREAAAKWLDTPEALALRHQVVRSNLGRGEDALSRISSAQEGMHEAAAGLTPEARAAAAEARLNDSSALTRRLRELGPKVVLPAIGGALAGPAGAGAGGLLGAISGRSATTVRNAIADPYVASRLLGGGASLLGGAGKTAAATAPAAASMATEPLSPWTRFLHPEEEK